MSLGSEQPLMRDLRGLDLGVARQDRGVGDAKPLGSLALGEQEVVDTLLTHDARSLLRHGKAQEFRTRVGSSVHRRSGQKSDSSDACG